MISNLSCVSHLMALFPCSQVGLWILCYTLEVDMCNNSEVVPNI